MQTLQPEAAAGTQQPYVVTQQSISVTQASAKFNLLLLLFVTSPELKRSIFSNLHLCLDFHSRAQML